MIVRPAMATQRELSRPEATSGAAGLSAPGDLSSSAASFARYLRAANIAPATLKTYAEAVRTLAAFLGGRPWALIPMARREWPAQEPLAGPVRLSIELGVAALLTRNVLSLARVALGEVEGYGGLSTTGHRSPSAP